MVGYISCQVEADSTMTFQIRNPNKLTGGATGGPIFCFVMEEQKSVP